MTRQQSGKGLPALGSAGAQRVEQVMGWSGIHQDEGHGEKERKKMRKNRERGPEKIFEEIIAENLPNMGKETFNQVQEAQSPRQDKPKE